MSGTLLAGLGVALFVGLNIGGSSTGVAFGPATGANATDKLTAGILMSVCALLGGWTVGRNVIDTVGFQITSAGSFSLLAGTAVLAIIGGSLLVSNLAGVPASTSMIAVSAMAGMGLAGEGVDWRLLAEIGAWWVVSPTIALAVGYAIGVSFFEDAGFETVQSPTNGIAERIPTPAVKAVILLVACYMAFSAGASNVANAVAPLVGSGHLRMNAGILLAGLGISIGALTLARRTLDTVGSGLAALPLEIALCVTVIGATLTTALSWLGIPVSLALTTVACIAGVGWGRTRGMTDSHNGPQPTIAECTSRDSTTLFNTPVVERQRFDRDTATEIILLWTAAPLLAGFVSYLFFLTTSA